MIDVGSLIFVRGHRAVVTGITRYGYYHPNRGAAELLHVYYLSGIASTEIRPIIRTFAPGSSCIVITDESAVSA